MPKKFQGENSKAVVAKARKAEKAAEEKAQKDKAAADKYWQEDDKLIVKKLQRKEEKERKKVEDAQRKKEKKLLEEEEDREITPTTLPPKITAYQVMKQVEASAVSKQKEKSEAEKSHLDEPLVENLNALNVDTISASGLDAAVAALSTKDNAPQDRHPEKRMAAAFRAFEEQRMPSLKKDNPTMRLSQLKQLLRKEWQKSPQNPLNQRFDS